MNIKFSLSLSAMAAMGLLWSLPVVAAPAGGCPDAAYLRSIQKNMIASNTRAKDAIKQNIMVGCDPVFPQRQGGLSGDLTSENTMQMRIKTPPSAPSLKYKDVAPVAGCNANTFGKPGGKSEGGTLTNCEKGSATPLPPITPPDLTDPPPYSKGEKDCLRRLATTFEDNGGSIFDQMCAYAGVKICSYTFEESGCIGDQDGDGGPAPPQGFFTYTGQFATLGIDDYYLKGPYYLHFGGTLTLPDDTIINIDEQRFVYLDVEDKTVRVYDSTPTTYYEYHFPTDDTKVQLRGNDEVLYVALCALDDSCF
ncbi:MAG: hypothetical protein U1E36_08940 [Rickettsiales bacterium]